jgi:parallel beta-helix repeat protein
VPMTPRPRRSERHPDGRTPHSHRAPVSPSRARRVSRWAFASAGAALLTALPVIPAGASTSAASSATIVVHPGQSIQAAVDRARSGDTIKIQAGTYREAVCVDHKGLTVVGAGRSKTTITWPAWSTVDQLPAVASTPCWTAEQSANRAGNPATLADDVSGLFFLDPDRPVTVSGLTTQNHPANGIAAWGAHGVTVTDTAGIGHGRNGVLAAASTKTRITGNVELGVQRPAAHLPANSGIAVTDSAAARAAVSGNSVTGYAYGIYARESRGGSISGNVTTANCAGIRVFDDTATQVPDASGIVQTGSWTITGNASVANNRYCIVNPVLNQRTSGVGVVIISADHVTVSGNKILGDHPGTSPDGIPADFGSGGLVLVSLGAPPIPGAVDPGPVEDVTVTGNTITGNQPFDVLVAQPTGIPGSLVKAPGPGLVFRANTCAVSNQPGICTG